MVGPSTIITVINGPNLARLGEREPRFYGSVTQDELIGMLRMKAEQLGCEVEFFQSDIEGELIRAVNAASGRSAGLVINPAGYSHYSVSILDSMRSFRGPVVEVHISRVFGRDDYRRNLLTACGADVLIAGAGAEGYLHALEILHEMIRKKDGGSVSANQ